MEKFKYLSLVKILIMPIIILVFMLKTDIQAKEKTVHESKVDVKNGLIYENSTGKLYNGYAYRSYPNGHLKEVGFLNCGFWFGEYKNYYESGKLKEKAMYDTDKLHGSYERYYESGHLQEKGTYFFSKKNGVFYYDNDDDGNIEHPLYDGLCKKLAKYMNPVYLDKYLYFAKQRTAKDDTDVISTIFLYLTAPNHWKKAEWSKRFDACIRKVAPGSFYRYLLLPC